MFENFFSFIQTALKLDKANAILFAYMLLRGLIIYFTSFLLIRFNKRFMGIRTPFNFILFVMLGSLSAAAITEYRPFLPILGVILALIFLNRIISAIEYHFPRFEKLFKGPIIVLVKNGEIQWNNMERTYITKRELMNELQQRLHTRDLKSIASALLTSDGQINFIRRQKKATFTQKPSKSK